MEVSMRFEAVDMTLVGVLVFAFAVTQAQAQCSCENETPVYNFTTVDPNDTEWMEDFPWKFESCNGTEVRVSLVFEDNPLLDTYFIDKEENIRIFLNGKWQLFPEFNAWAIEHCPMATS